MKKVFILLLTLIFALPMSSQASVIYIVKPGDTLYKISQQYEVDPNDISAINGITGDQLVPGQSLIIDTNEYIGSEDETFLDIAARHQVSMFHLMQQNDFSDLIKPGGKKIQIPKPLKTDVTISSFASPDHIADGVSGRKFKFLNQIAAFEYHPDEEGHLSQLEQMDSFKDILWKNDVAPYVTVTNISEDGFDAKLARKLLNNPKRSGVLIEEIYQKLDQYDLKGVVIDFEGLSPKDQTLFNQFIRQLAERLQPADMEVGIAVPPLQSAKKPAWNTGYDYKTLGRYADFIFLMTYDWHWRGGEPGPISPINNVSETLSYATSVMPKEKIIMGIPLYAYDWPSYWPLYVGTGQAQAYSQQKAIEKALNYGSSIQYDEESQTPWFSYTDEDGFNHKVWFEDARSLLAKYELVKKYRIKGIGAWQMKFNFPQSEHMIMEHFN
ncbi:glycosyl hydrolase family 18 protein [Aquisalibacillus elongatus]|uniref:Spore germination protein n=1 Tax=Aquisalibacillus elongatus TaxID=485577 RepID=A0A3N5C6Y6_9BACI|nr:glycosyl hydrolase family 18 protein [Aquisalibacillus elongatus]RPF52201.1 spore germination protein [Aquisalibacillus elongatus]